MPDPATPGATSTPTVPATPPAPPPPPPAVPPPPSCDCGPLAPQPGENPIKVGTSPDAILNRIQLECGPKTGVFFFRYQGGLYLRVVKLG